MSSEKINVGSEITLKEFTQELLKTPDPLSIGYLAGKIEGTEVVVQGVNMPGEWAGKLHALDDSDLEKAVEAERANERNIVGIAAYTGDYAIESEYSQVRDSREHLASKGLPDLSVQFGEGIHLGEEDYKTFPEDCKIFS